MWLVTALLGEETGMPSGAEPKVVGGLDMQDLASLGLISVIQNGELTLFVEGEIDVASVPALAARLSLEIPQVTSRLVLDLGGVTFMDSSGLSVLVRAYKRLRRAQADLVLKAPNPTIQKTLDITGLAKVFTIEA